MVRYILLWVALAAACALASLAMARQLPAAPPAAEPSVLQHAQPPSWRAIGAVVGMGTAASPLAFGHIRRHRDRSVAGADVILGGLVTAILAAVFCYIRVTRQKEGQEKA